MIIRCPSCNERISNKNAVCPKCEYDLQGTGEGLSYDDVVRRNKRESSYRLAMHSYGALGLTTIGAIWGWVTSEQMSHSPGLYPTLTLAAGGLWYVVVRLIMIVRRLKSE